MTPRRAVSALFAVLAATMLVTGSFGFTSVSADRGVSINVVESENAYVGATACQTGQGNGNGSNSVKVTVTNQYSAPFTVDGIRWSESAHGSKDRLDPDVTLAPGESETFNNAFGEQEVTVEVTDGLDASVTVEVADEQCSNNGEGVDENPDGGENGTATPTPEPTETPTPEGNETDDE